MSPESPLPINAWWTMTTTAVADLRRASEFGVNMLIIENDCRVEWNRLLDGLAAYDFDDDLRREGDRRTNVERFRRRFREICTAAEERGVSTHIMCPEIDVPPGFQITSAADPRLWRLVRERLREIFRALPGLGGFVLYLCEGQREVFDLPGATEDPAGAVKRLIGAVWEACRAERRKLAVATFIHRLPKLEAVCTALRSFPPHPDFAVLQYCCPSDWGLYALMNPAIGKVGGHPEILGFDYAAENWGQGAHPFVHADFMVRRFREARALGSRLVGIAGYVAWYGKSVLGTLNEANVWAGSVLAREPPAADLLHDWCGRRFGPEAAGTARRCLARTHPAVFKAQHVFDYWLDTGEKSGLPSVAELDEYFIGDFFGESLAGWDPERADVWQSIRNPDDAFLTRMLEEKREAVDLCRRSLKELRADRAAFSAEDFDLLERAFVFQELWARTWKAAVHAFFLWQMIRRGDRSRGRLSALTGVLAALAACANELEKTFGVDVFPRGPGRIRDFIKDIRSSVSALQ